MAHRVSKCVCPSVKHSNAVCPRVRASSTVMSSGLRLPQGLSVPQGPPKGFSREAFPKITSKPRSQRLFPIMLPPEAFFQTVWNMGQRAGDVGLVFVTRIVRRIVGARLVHIESTGDTL